MSERFSDSLRATATPIWDAIFRHPFLSQMGAGTLAEETFRFYICQDYHFLEGFARTVAIALSKAPDSEALLLLSKRVPVPIERELHRSLFSMLEMDVGDAEGMEPAPTNRAYINHLLSTATLGSVGDAAAALLPCPWTYHEIGHSCAKQSTPSTSRGPPSISRASWPKASRPGAFCWIGRQRMREKRSEGACKTPS